MNNSSDVNGGCELTPDEERDMYRELWENMFVVVDPVKISGSLVWNLVKNIKIGGDLTRITVPPSLLRGMSSLELYALAFSGLKFFENIKYKEKPQDRLLSIVQWYLVWSANSIFNHFYGLKPYNSILGEQLHCYWSHSDGSRTKFIGEQVEHHPPTTAYFVENKEHGFRLYGDSLLKFTFHGNSAEGHLKGSSTFQFDLNDGSLDTVVLKEPPATAVYGILYGAQRTGVKGFFRGNSEDFPFGFSVQFLKGKSQKVEGCIFCTDEDNNEKKTPIYKITGSLLTQVTVTDVESGKEVSKLDFSHIGNSREFLLPFFTKPLRQQNGYETRKVWHGLTRALMRGDEDEAAKRKHEVEEEQRRLRKERKERGVLWKPKLFRYDEDSKSWILEPSVEQEKNKIVVE